MTHPLFVIIMAGGKGTRIGAADKPKVMFDLRGKPMLAYVIAQAKSIGVERPIVVTGFKSKVIRDYFGRACIYVHQKRQLGTANAVECARRLLEDKPGVTLILSGDHPFIERETLKKLAAEVAHGADIAILTGELSGSAFDSMGRLITDDRNRVKRVVEVKDATEDEKQIRRVNLGTYAVNNQWLWKAIARIKPSPATGEYYLTDIIQLAFDDGKKIEAITIQNPREAIGINTLDHLAEASG